MDWVVCPATALPLWIADQVRNDGVGVLVCLVHPLLPCQALGQALVLCHQGRWGFCRLCCLDICPSLHLWIADQVRNDGVGVLVCLVHPLLPCQALGQALVLCHQGRGGFCRLCCLDVCPSLHLWIADQVRNDGPGVGVLEW